MKLKTLKNIVSLWCVTLAFGLAAQASELGAPVSDANASVPELSDWCVRVSTILNRELLRAENLAEREQFAQSWAVLKSALTAVSKSMQVDPDFGGPMTKRLVDRGLVYANEIDRVTPNAGVQLQVSKLNFLFEYTQFIIRMEDYLDRPWFIPYRYQYRRCGIRCAPGFDFGAFQRVYLDFSRQQLEFVARALTLTDGYGRVAPVGDPRAFLKIAEINTGVVASEISENLFAFSKACTIESLRNLSVTLSQFNSGGDRTVYPNYRVAVSETYRQMMAAADQLSYDPTQCWR